MATVLVRMDHGVTNAYDREHLETAVLLRMEHGHNLGAVKQTLVEEFGFASAYAIELTIAAGRCIEQGIEP